MNSARVSNKSLALALLLACGGLTTPATAAVSSSWNTTVNGATWNTAGNWSPATVPNGVGDTATLSGFDGANPSGYANASDTSGAHSVVINTAVTLGTLNVINPNNYNTQTFNISLSGGSLTMDQDGAGAGRATILANYHSTNRNLTIPNLILADDLELRSTISPLGTIVTNNFNDGGVSRTITKTGAGAFAIGSGFATTNLTGGGTIDIQEGLLRFYKASAGNYNITLSTSNSKTLLFTNNGTANDMPLQNVTVTGTNSKIEIGPNTAGSGNVDVGNWTVNTGLTATLQFDSSYTATTNTGKAFDIQSGATVDLTNSAANGAGKLMVKGTLKGAGTITTADNGSGTTRVQMLSGGNLTPGASAGASAIFNVGSVSASNTHLLFDSGSSFTVDLNGLAAGTGYDQLNLTGDVNLGGATLVKTLTFDPAGQTANFFIIANDSTDAVVGNFAGLADGASFNMTGGGATIPFKISYFGDSGSNAVTGGNDVVIYAVPEPASLALLAVGGLLAVGRRRGAARG